MKPVIASCGNAARNKDNKKSNVVVVFVLERSIDN